MLVTGHEVTVVWVTTVTVESGAVVGLTTGDELGAGVETGATLEGPGTETEGLEGPGTGTDGPPGPLGTAVELDEHRVQIVEVEVSVTVDMVWVVCKLVVPPVVIVLVTGQEVTVV